MSILSLPRLVALSTHLTILEIRSGSRRFNNSKNSFESLKCKQWHAMPINIGAPGRNRTGTIVADHKILSLACLPISPPGHTLNIRTNILASKSNSSSPAWNRTTNQNLEGFCYIHLTTRPSGPCRT